MIDTYITNELKNDIKNLFTQIDTDAVVIHSDLLGLNGLIKPYDKKGTLNELLENIINASSDKTLLIPTYNYDFCRTGIYDVNRSICQIGALNEWARMYPNFQRTHTPVFNYAIYNNKNINLEPIENVFGKASIFHEFVKNNSTICLFGTDFTANTFMYHIEEMRNIGYRYLKQFSGKIIYENDMQKDFTIEYRVRPRIKGIFTTPDEFIDYDYARHGVELEEAGLLYKFNLQNKKAICYKANEAYNFLLNKLKQNELYFLTQKSQENVKKLYEQYGYPLTYEKIENNQ